MANAVMLVRVCALVGAINVALLTLIVPPLLLAAVVACMFGGHAVYRQHADRSADAEVEFPNPFGFWLVVGFAVFLGLVILLGRVLGETFGAAGAIAGSAAVGIADVDSVAVSMAQLVPELLSVNQGALAILTGVAVNTVAKMVYGAVIGRGRFAAEIAIMSFGALIVGAAAAWAAFTFLAP
jgi:uncharacterized membrane protein (DUF4010 family)